MANKNVSKSVKRAIVVTLLISYAIKLTEKRDYGIVSLHNRVESAKKVFKRLLNTKDFMEVSDLATTIWHLNDKNEDIIIDDSEMPYFIMMVSSLMPSRDHKDFLKLPCYITEMRLSKEKEQAIQFVLEKANELLIERLKVNPPQSNFIPVKKKKEKKKRDVSKKVKNTQPIKNKNVNKILKKRAVKQKTLTTLQKKIRMSKRKKMLKNILLSLSKYHKSYSIVIKEITTL